MAMNEIQIAHLNRILDTTHDLIANKYAKGAAEHKTILSVDYSSAELIEFAIEEAVDQITYLLTLREMIRNGK